MAARPPSRQNRCFHCYFRHVPYRLDLLPVVGIAYGILKKKNSQLHRIVESVVLSYYTSDHILDILRYSEQLLFDMIRIAISFHANNKQIYIYI